jgi:hypothetical protein
MTEKTIIETQLDCRATASLRSEIAEDLSQPDKPMSELLSETEDESNNKPHNSD